MAKGKDYPVSPYFFLHEYKPEDKKGVGAVGQLLITMLAAQAANAADAPAPKTALPLYGCYVLGRMWVFGVLTGKEYAFHSGLNAMNDDIFTIVALIRRVKEYVYRFLHP